METLDSFRSAREIMQGITLQDVEKEAAAAPIPKTEMVDCRLCGKPAECDEEARGDYRFYVKCEECREKERQEQIERRLDYFNQKCPSLYAKTEIEKLPPEGAAVFERLKKYEYGSRGLIFAGATGKGKTRVMWMVLKRLFMRGKGITVFDWHECLQAVMDHDKMKKWLSHISAPDAHCLLMDDFGKNKFTDRVEAEIFDIIEKRTSQERPLFITTNETPDTLKARMSADRGEPMLRRLFEFCDVYTF